MSTKILVTGSNGFIGKNILPPLVSKGYDIFCPQRQDYDLVNEADVNRLFENHNFDTVIHLAADVGGIQRIKNFPGEVFFNNVLLNTLIMEYSRRNSVSKFIALNTINSYPELDKVLVEDDYWSGRPNKDIFSYGMSKRLAIAQSEVYYNQYQFNSINLILDNTYGPYDDFDGPFARVIPSLINKFFKAKSENLSSVSVWGSGQSRRQFFYVEDLVKIVLDIVENNHKNFTINVSSGETVTISDLAHLISKSINYDGKIIFDKSMPEGNKIRVMSNEKLLSKFGKSKFHKLEEGIKKTVDWYKVNRKS